MVSYVGYHGTSSENCSRILTENFKISEDASLKYGAGAYFFIGDISDPQSDARLWAFRIARNHGNWDGPVRFKMISILSASIDLQSVFDTRISEYKRYFNAARAVILEDYGEKPDKHVDDKIFRTLSQSGEYQGIIVEATTKFLSHFRSGAHFNMPNTTILCVCLPETCISLDGIVCVEELAAEDQ